MQSLSSYNQFISSASPNLVVCMDDRELDPGQTMLFGTIGSDVIYDQIAGGASGFTTDRLIVEEVCRPGYVLDQKRSKVDHTRSDAASARSTGIILANHIACAAQLGDVPVLEAMHDKVGDVIDELEETVRIPTTRRDTLKRIASVAGKLAIELPRLETPEEELAAMSQDCHGDEYEGIPALKLADKPHAASDLIFNLVDGDVFNVTQANIEGNPAYFASPRNVHKAYNPNSSVSFFRDFYLATTALRHIIIARYFLKTPQGDPLNFLVRNGTSNIGRTLEFPN